MPTVVAAAMGAAVLLFEPTDLRGLDILTDIAQVSIMVVTMMVTVTVLKWNKGRPNEVCHSNDGAGLFADPQSPWQYWQC